MPDRCQRITFLTSAVSSNPPNLQQPDVSHHTPRPSNEVYDAYDPSAFTTFARQRQQPPDPARPSSSRSADYRPSSVSDSQRTLRRVRRHPESGQLPHRRAFSQDIPGRQPPRFHPAHSAFRAAHPRTDHSLPNVRPAASEAQTDEHGSTVDDPYQLLDSSYWPARTTRVSSRTASAILYTLEDAIRRPIPFTVDWDEVNASMSEMVGVAGPAGPVGNGRVSNGPRAPPVPASANPRAPSGVRTPTEIMRSRRDREARQKAEQEAREREQEELERQQVEQEQLALAQAQAQQYAAGAAGASSDPAQRRARTQRAPRGPETQLEPLNTAIPASASVRPPPAAAQPYQVPSDIPNQPLPNPSLSQQKIPSTTPLVQAQSAPAPGGPSGATGIPKQPQPPQPAQPDTSLQQPRRATFPHAFERWETLSSHWEGLTSYWIRKLEQNNDDLEKDPLSQQLARQITDLSAAGANLFHAVVELQRLRASSERKFQRWFFDTRSEQERAKELQADLERQVQTERQGRTEALATSQAAEKDKNRSEELLREMRRELQISKDEARRAWEELGRREQEERERTNSLRNGEPTLVGGVQVVPMIQGLPNRNTRPPTREGPYPGGPTTTSMGTEYQGKGPDPNASRTYYDEGTAMSPTGSDPFIEEQQAQARSDVPTSNPPYSTAVYEPGTTATSYPAHTAEQDDLHSYVGSSEAGDDEYPGFHPDASSQGYGYAAPPRSEGSDEYTHSPVDDRHYTSEGAYTGATTAPVQAPYPPTTADYSGSDWGPEWGSITPRHRHPTRLSDVLEEDEPSRTSPSRASQASRSIL